ncbi:type IV pilus assembly protein PilM [Haloimpatiens sp. FM7330]|uniref:type IV pilus assembly protein PilM n=1 Tax=Haloimpatiens sp. FM7330 TaxID=3298610 RepID=UPI00363CED56
MFAKKILSIDIGTKNTKIVQGKFNKNKVTVEKAFTIHTPENCYSDGNINDVNRLKKEIKKELQDRNIKANKVIFTSQSTSIITREIEIPSADSKDMDGMIRLQIERYLPIMSDDYVIQYKIVEEFKEENILKSKVRVAAYPKVMSEGYLNLAKELELFPYVLDINCNSISKLFAYTSYINERDYDENIANAFMDIGSDYINFTIVRNKNVEFTRLVTIGGSYIDSEISRKLVISEKQAEIKKIKLGNLRKEENENIEANMINESIKSKLKECADEIDRMIQYYKNKNEGNKLENIYIYGGISKIKGIDKYLTDILRVPVIKILNISNLDLISFDGDIVDYLNAAGALIRFK